MACANNHLELAQFLLTKGADINIQNKNANTSLHWAALTGNLQIVKILCETEGHKINCNLKNFSGKIPFEEAL